MKEKTVYRIREFNRFYMPALDLLGNHYLGSEYSAAEARVLFEVYACDGCNAAHIARTMDLDKSYLSRIIQHHIKSGYLVRVRSAADFRAFDLHLTEAGRERTEELIRKSNEQIREIIAPMNEAECRKLIDALDTITGILKSCGERGTL